MTKDSGPAKLLVKAALESVLSKSASRLDAEARGERIKAAALMECADKGYSELTITNIARRAKVSTSTIYAEYSDRDKLLVAAMEMLFALLASDVIETPKTDDPRERVERLLIAHGQVYAQPLTAWLTRLHVTLAWAGYGHLREIGQQVFRGIDAFWVKFLSDLEGEGHLNGIEPDVVVPLLLGPIERCTIISRLACGDDDPRRPSLDAVARDCTEKLFRLWGNGARAIRFDAGGEAERLLKGLKPPAVSSAQDGQGHLTKGPRSTPQDQKASILRAAKTLCGELGFEVTNMRDIATRAGVSTATLYSHFEDKTSVFQTALESEFAQHGGFALHHGTTALDAALLNIASRAANTGWAWMYNVMMASSISDDPRIVAIGRKNRDMTDAFLAGAIEGKPDDLTSNFLLGAVERSSALALILFGPASVDLPQLARLASATAQCHLALNEA